MLKFTSLEMNKGIDAICIMSDAAWEFYQKIEPFDVYERNDLYYVRSCVGNHDGLTFEQLEELMEDLAKE